MSNYTATAIHPTTGKAEKAEFLDDYFGRHQYGVRFPCDPVVYHYTDICRVKESAK